MSNIIPTWFIYITIFISAATIGVSIPNIIYFNHLRTGTSTGITTGQATTMLWVNIILLIIAIMLFIMSIWMAVSAVRYVPNTKKHKNGDIPMKSMVTIPDNDEPTHFLVHKDNIIQGDNVVTSQELSGNVVSANL